MFFKIKTKILMPCFIATIAVLGFWLFFNPQKTDNNMTEKNNYLTRIFKEKKGEKTESFGRELSPVSASEQTKEYENIKYGFSFNYPSDFKASEFAGEDGKTVLTVQNAKTGEGLQIYITTYDDSGFVANKERILRDVPDLSFSNSADVIVGGKAKGVAFSSQNEAFGGDTAEVWFAHESKFFQATTYRKDVGLLEEIIKSWKLSN